MFSTQVSTVLDLAQNLAVAHPALFLIQGPGRGDRVTAAYIKALRNAAAERLGRDFAECSLTSSHGARVDYWFPEERTILEIAFGLRNPLSEFERDVLKAVMARAAGVSVEHLVLLAKPGAHSRLKAPWFRAVIRWARSQGITVHVRELAYPATG